MSSSTWRQTRRADRVPASGWHEAVITGAYPGCNRTTGTEYLTIDAALRGGFQLRFSLTYGGASSVIVENSLRVLVALAEALELPPRRDPASFAATLALIRAPVLLNVAQVTKGRGTQALLVVVGARRLEAN